MLAMLSILAMLACLLLCTEVEDNFNWRRWMHSLQKVCARGKVANQVVNYKTPAGVWVSMEDF